MLEMFRVVEQQNRGDKFGKMEEETNHICDAKQFSAILYGLNLTATFAFRNLSMLKSLLSANS